jgi:aspartyl-tRNA(Asn)/glutamyl-tRNA(Gln) amidotransferase subunit C
MISREEIDNLANLARLELDDAQKESLIKDLGNILGYIDLLNEAGDLAVGSTENEYAAPNVMRHDTDAHQSGQFTESLVEAAPKHNGQYIRVKKIL